MWRGTRVFQFILKKRNSIQERRESTLSCPIMVRNTECGLYNDGRGRMLQNRTFCSLHQVIMHLITCGDGIHEKGFCFHSPALWLCHKIQQLLDKTLYHLSKVSYPSCLQHGKINSRIECVPLTNTIFIICEHNLVGENINKYPATQERLIREPVAPLINEMEKIEQLGICFS